MSRYTQTYLANIEPSGLREAVLDVLGACGLSIIFVAEDYIKAQEKPGKVNFSRLVAVEILIHQPSSESNSTKITCITKNGELPLQIDNHCQKMSELVASKFMRGQTWKLLESSLV